MKFFRPHHIISVLAGGGLLFAVIFGQPLFSNLDQFVLVAEDAIHLANNVQVSSGDLASNKEISIAENNIINSDLFSDEVKIAENTQINGNTSFNKFKLADNSQILGEQTSPISLPIIKLPEIPDFQTGEEDLIIDSDQIINPQNLNKLEIKENATLSLNPGTYNLNSFELRDNSKLLFSGNTIINIKQSFNAGNEVLIAPLDSQLSSRALTINVESESKAASKGKSKQEPKGVQPVSIGNDSFLNFKLLVSNTKLILGERNTFRGQILAREIQVGEDSVLSREEVFTTEPDANKIVLDSSVKYPVNEIVIQLSSNATQNDALRIANSVGGRVIGIIPEINLYKIDVAVSTITELESKIKDILALQNPLILSVTQNFLLEFAKQY